MYKFTFTSPERGKSKTLHYANMPMHYAEILKDYKNDIFFYEKFEYFLIFAQNIDCGYTLEPPH